MSFKSDVEIAHDANMLSIFQIAKKIGISQEHLHPYGHFKAKIDLDFIAQQKNKKDGKLILITAITPTTYGEGKTTTTVGLGDGLNRIGKKAMICLREPALGPCFGLKGGAAGGGYSQIIPMEDINLHFTGDFHAITSAHNLLSALIDNHIYWGNELGIDPGKITWRRVIDMNDRALREIIIALGKGENGPPREEGFDITVASEIMAILCLSSSMEDLENRLNQIVIGKNYNNQSIKAKDLKATGAMMALLKDAIMPNLVQTLENNPVLVHGGPFANISLGCNSIMATGLALKLSDFVVTEAGFGADLGAEKFFNIKCRKANFNPHVVVIVVTVRALKSQGGINKDDLKQENLLGLNIGLSNLACHIENIQKFGVPTCVAINYFSGDTQEEIQSIIDFCSKININAFKCTNWSEGGDGIEKLSQHVAYLAEQNDKPFRPLYPNERSLWEKIKVIAKEIYRARDIEASAHVQDKLKNFEELGYGHFPVCIAKTQYSFSTNPALKGAPDNHVVYIRDVYLAAGAEFIVVICGDIMTMPGLPKTPHAEHIKIINNKIEGLF